MRTEKLFEQDSNLTEFEATVEECQAVKDGYEVVLNRTAFFPEEAGQYADTGWLGDAEVVDAQIREGVIYHKVKEPLKPQTTVKGRLDWNERFLKMQQHTGEHIVSGIVHRLFGYQNVGFHLGNEDSTMDYNQELTMEQLRQVEWEANRAVAQNLPVVVSYPSDEELQTLSYRSKKEILEQIRIVSIPGYDVCACCAPHVTHTGQVGMIKLTQMQRYKGGVRVHMLCGFRALHAYTKQQEQVAEVMQALSVPETGVAQGVLRMKEELTQWKYRHAQLQKAYLQGYAKELAQQTSAYVAQVETQLDAEGARVLMNELLEYGKELCAIFCETNENEFRYVIGSKTIDVRPLATWMKEELSGRGGGKPQMIQGSVFGESEAIKAWMMDAVSKLKEPHQKEVHKEEQHA